jgi:hypothetical protein
LVRKVCRVQPYCRDSPPLCSCLDCSDWPICCRSLGPAWISILRGLGNAPNHVGRVCLDGEDCTSDRELLDLFEVAEDPASGKAAVIYTDTTIDTWTLGGGIHKLPEIVLAYEQ